MSDLQAIADRVEIKALRGEFTDAVMVHDHDRSASRLTHDGAVRIPQINAGGDNPSFAAPGPSTRHYRYRGCGTPGCTS